MTQERFRVERLPNDRIEISMSDINSNADTHIIVSSSVAGKMRSMIDKAINSKKYTGEMNRDDKEWDVQESLRLNNI